jgi:Cellulose biosynthesis protein BcsN
MIASAVRKASKNASLLALAAFALAGCTTWPIDRQLTSATVVSPTPLDGYQYGITEEKPLTRAFVELPWLAGQPIAVREKRYANGVEQTVILQGEAAADGENRVEVRVTQSASSDERISGEYLQVRNTRQEQIRSDMKEFTWGVPMKIVSAVESNAYGTYGYALGRSKMGSNCLLGWQNVKGEMKAKKAFGFMSSRKTELSIRMRVCRSDLNEEQLVSVIRGYRITFDPTALLHEPKVVWRNDGVNISGVYGADSGVPGYVTEGVAPGSVPAPLIDPIDPQLPIADVPALPAEPAVRKRPSPVQTAATPTRKTQNRERRAAQPAVELTRAQREEMLKNGQNPDDLESLDPMRNKTTIFVDPREYAAVPLPGDVTQAGTLPVPDGAGAGNDSRFSVPGSASAPSASDMSDPQSEAARKRRKELVGQLPASSETMASTPGGGAGGSGGKQGLFLAPEREGYRGLDVKDIQRTDRVQGDNAKHNLWLNDVARNDRDGLPLGRPCELMRDCKDEPKRKLPPAPNW